jgi:uncharacterized protein (TIGR03083 family)
VDAPTERRQRHADAIAAFVAAMERAPDATVPAYPSWTVRDLAVHLITVHAMAATAIETLAEERPSVRPPVDATADTGTLATHLHSARDRLETALAATTARQVWALRPAQPPETWRRRMLMEATLHGYDARTAAGDTSAPPEEVARDGIDDFLHLHGWRGLRASTDLDGVVELRAGPTTWRVDLATAEVERDPVEGRADASVTGSAAELWLWCNRRPRPAHAIVVEDPDGRVARWVEVLDGLGGPAG